MPATEPITAGLNLGTALVTMVTGVLPSDETQRDLFKMRYPIIYARIRKKMYNQCLTHLRFRWHEDIDKWVDFTCGGLLPDEREYMKQLLHQTLKR